MSEEKRTGHPYRMYEAIQQQPEAFAESIGQNKAGVEKLAGQLAGAERVFIVGTGTSFHAAQAGQFLFQAYAGDLPVQAIPAFDFALYGPALKPGDVVIAISHRGTKTYTVEALKKAAQAGCPIALVTGKGTPEGATYAWVTFQTVAQEKSSAHTISYTGAVAVLAALALETGFRRAGEYLLAPDYLTGELPAILRQALEKEGQVAQLAAQYLNRRRFWLTGGGPGAIIATEVALKIKETSYLQAEGMAVETLLHGPLQCTEDDDLFVLIAPAGPAQKRVAELAGQIQEIGAPFVVVGDSTDEELFPGAVSFIQVPQVPEPFTALTCLYPLQLFSYHLALVRGTDPDGFRLNDPRFARAGKVLKL